MPAYYRIGDMIKGIQEDIKNLSAYDNESIYIDRRLWEALTPNSREMLDRQAETARVKILVQ